MPKKSVETVEYIGTWQAQCLKFQIQLYMGVLMLGYLIHQHMKQLAI